MLASLNSSELARRRFREIARVSGLISTGYPGQPKSTRQLQASSTLFYEVFRKYDEGNMLLGQAERESGKGQLKPMAGGDPIPVALSEVAQAVRAAPALSPRG